MTNVEKWGVSVLLVTACSMSALLASQAPFAVTAANVRSAVNDFELNCYLPASGDSDKKYVPAALIENFDEPKCTALWRTIRRGIERQIDNDALRGVSSRTSGLVARLPPSLTGTPNRYLE